MKITPQAKPKLEYLPFVAGVDRMQHTVMLEGLMDPLRNHPNSLPSVIPISGN